jgi:uncharacterized RDD family membrane protein YckC
LYVAPARLGYSLIILAGSFLKTGRTLGLTKLRFNQIFYLKLLSELLPMNCLRCGEVCRCDPEASSAPTPRLAADASESLLPATQLAPETNEQGTDGAPTDEPASAWRDELTAKLSNYRARRKTRPPRYPSLRLRFEAESPSSVPASSELAAFETLSNQALALDGMTQLPTPAEAEWDPSHSESSDGPAENGNSRTGPSPKLSHGAKVIEFPRSSEFRPEFLRSDPPAPTSYNELAGPVMAPPRILEAPEIVPPPPALGGITIEAAEPKGVQRRAGIEVPLQAAPLSRRMAAAAIDGLIIFLATALFGSIFWKLTSMRPPLSQTLGLIAAVPCLLWAAYQYLLLVYAGTTPGLRFAGLEVARFDGTWANRRLRRWRVLASYLGAVSLGMGYVWVLLDEDSLCWHDRITHTYLAPKK